MKRKREIGYKDNYAILVEQSQKVFLSIRMENGKRVLKRRRRKQVFNARDAWKVSVRGK